MAANNTNEMNAVMFTTLITSNRVGLTLTTANEVTTTQGITDMSTLITFITEEQVLNLGKAVKTGYQAPAAIPAPPIPFVSAVSATKLHAVWYWGILRKRCGRAANPAQTVLTQAQIANTMNRIRYEKQVKEAAKNGELKKPTVLKKVEKFNEWFDTWNTYMSSIRGAARIPLPYVYRKHVQVTDIMRNETYPTSDEEYMILFDLAGSYYDVDNTKVFNELMPYVVGGPCESIVKPFRRTTDGRAAVLALHAYANGTSAQERRASTAYTTIDSTVYKRQSRAFTLDDFFGRLRDAYAILSHPDINQPVTEQRKWQDTLDKIQDSTLETAKMALRASATQTRTFEALASKMKELAHEIYKSRKQPRQERLVGSATTIKDSELHGNNWTNADWAKLSKPQQDKVRELRKAKKERQKRKIKATQQETDTSDDDSDATKDNAGTKFGRNAHSKKGKTDKDKK